MSDVLGAAVPARGFEGTLRLLPAPASAATFCAGWHGGDMLALGLGGFGLGLSMALSLAAPDRESLRRTQALRRAAAQARCARARNP